MNKISTVTKTIKTSKLDVNEKFKATTPKVILFDNKFNKNIFNKKLNNNVVTKTRLVDFDKKFFNPVINLKLNLAIKFVNRITPELKLIVEKNIYRFIEDNKDNDQLLSNIVNYLQEGTISDALNNSKIIINDTEYKLTDLLNIVNYHRPNFFSLNNRFGLNNITKTSNRIIQKIYRENQTIRFSNQLKYYVKNKHKINKHVKDIIVSNLKKIIDNASYELREQIYQVLSPHSDGEVTEIKNEYIQNMLEIILYRRHSNFITNNLKYSIEILDHILPKIKTI